MRYILSTSTCILFYMADLQLFYSVCGEVQVDQVPQQMALNLDTGKHTGGDIA